MSSVEVQARTALSSHTDCGIERQDLSLCAVTPRLTLPLTVLRDGEGHWLKPNPPTCLSFIRHSTSSVLDILTARSSQDRGQDGPQLLKAVPGTSEQGETREQNKSEGLEEVDQVLLQQEPHSPGQ